MSFPVPCAYGHTFRFVLPPARQNSRERPAPVKAWGGKADDLNCEISNKTGISETGGDGRHKDKTAGLKTAFQQGKKNSQTE